MHTDEGGPAVGSGRTGSDSPDRRQRRHGDLHEKDWPPPPSALVLEALLWRQLAELPDSGDRAPLPGADPGATDPEEDWPEAAAVQVVQAIHDACDGPADPDDDPDPAAIDEALEAAGRVWAEAHRHFELARFRLLALGTVFSFESGPERIRLRAAWQHVDDAATMAIVERLERAAMTDPLTGAGNRRAFDGVLSRAVDHAHRKGLRLTVVAIDLDGLKRINDSDGHLAGDRALVSLAASASTVLRRSDSIFRTGGDEFALLLPGADAGSVPELMERIRQAGAPPFSWGASTLDAADGSVIDGQELIAAADADMYDRRRLERSARQSVRRIRRSPRSGGVRPPTPPGAVMTDDADTSPRLWLTAAIVVVGLSLSGWIVATPADRGGTAHASSAAPVAGDGSGLPSLAVGSPPPSGTSSPSGRTTLPVAAVPEATDRAGGGTTGTTGTTGTVPVGEPDRVPVATAPTTPATPATPAVPVVATVSTTPTGQAVAPAAGPQPTSVIVPDAGTGPAAGTTTNVPSSSSSASPAPLASRPDPTSAVSSLPTSTVSTVGSVTGILRNVVSATPVDSVVGPLLAP